MSINVDELRTELEKYRVEHNRGGQVGATRNVPVEVDEIIRLARQLEPPLGYDSIVKFLKSKGFKFGRSVVARRVKELGLLDNGLAEEK